MRFPSILRSTLLYVLDTVYPQVCCICGEISRSFFSETRNTITLGNRCIPVDFCPDCAARLEKAFGPWRRRTRIRNSEAYYLFDYSDETVKRIIRHVKTCRCDSCRKFFAAAAAGCIDKLIADGSTLTYIPRSRKLYNVYGFDQTKCVAEEYINIRPKAKFKPLFERGAGILHDTPQKLLNRTQRFENAKNSLSLIDKTDLPRSVVLFDDMITTGATADAAAALLEKENIGNIKLFFLASANFLIDPQ